VRRKFFSRVDGGREEGLACADPGAGPTSALAEIKISFLQKKELLFWKGLLLDKHQAHFPMCENIDAERQLFNALSNILLELITDKNQGAPESFECVYYMYDCIVYMVLFYEKGITLLDL
jgi:hypothetical protein